MTSSAEDTYLSSLPINEVVNTTEWIKKIDEQAIPMEDKLNKIIMAIECPKEYMELFGELIIEMTKRLRKLMRRNLKVIGFGSFFTNLALKNSDLDMLIDLKGSTLDNEEMILKRIRRMYYDRHFEHIFKSVVFIKAKVPILRFRHTIDFDCDVSVGIKLSKHNSELIKLYLSMGTNYRSFFLIVKFWIKRLGLSDIHLFKSYNLVLMILLFLQERGLIPSVEFLQNHPESRPTPLIEGWDSSFLDDINLGNLEVSDLSTIYLLRDFFKFYSKFEFGFYIISPFLGKSLLKPFQNHQDRFKYYVQNNGSFNDHTYVCIQDVFKHDFNPGYLITKQAVIDFQNHCQDAERLCCEAISNNSQVLEQLFIPSKKKRGKKTKNDNALIFLAGRKPSSGETEEEVCQNWFSDTLLAVESVLIKVAFVEKIIKKENCFLCSSSIMIFNKNRRAEVAKLTPMNNLSNLEYQEKISSALSELPECCLKTAYNFQLHYKFSREPTRIVMELTFENSNILEIDQFYAINKNLVQWLGQIQC